MARTKAGSIPPRFEPGAKVRVKFGVRDPDFADIPLGGWAGTVKEVERAEGVTTYLIAWDRATLKGMHPVSKKRCERDGLELESMWLGDEDLGADDGKKVSIEQPTEIVTGPLSERDQDDRVRLALGLTHDDPLPDVTRKTLLAYYRYLRDHLKLPFKARSEADGSSLTVHRLPDPKEYDLDEEKGLLCEARSREGPFDVPLAELDEAGSGNRKLVGDQGRASAHFLVDGKGFTESGRNPEKGFDIRRQCEAMVGESGKHWAFTAAPKSPKTHEFALVPRERSSEVL